VPPPPLPLAAPTADRRLYRPPPPQLPPASRVASAHPPLPDANPAAGDRCCCSISLLPIGNWPRI